MPIGLRCLPPTGGHDRYERSPYTHMFANNRRLYQGHARKFFMFFLFRSLCMCQFYGATTRLFRIRVPFRFDLVFSYFWAIRVQIFSLVEKSIPFDWSYNKSNRLGRSRYQKSQFTRKFKTAIISDLWYRVLSREVFVSKGSLQLKLTRILISR